MNVEHERLVLQYLEEALTWHRDERDWRLRVMLDRDPAMLADVRSLLDAADAANSSLPTKMPLALAPEDPPPPDRIGSYRLGSLLGQGGMGRVYRADRVDGVFEQTIAIKLMRRARMPALLEAQFARERQILARLQHRNIAQLFDGGVTPDGQSYFVMELVSGRSITHYAREERVPLRQTLLLFLQVCSAVQYAHSHLVVHADIKPNNIIVTADGAVKLLDFGVARVLEGTDQQGSGDSAALGITYEYASPARHRGEAPTTVDDVFSLGVLFAELTRRFDDRAADLTSIIKRARAPGAEQRYASVGELQADVERWLDGLPVLAHAGGLPYTAGRLIARHRLAVGIAAAALLLLVGAAVELGILYVRAEQAKQQAEQRFTDLRALSRYVLFDVHDRLEAMPRALTLRRDISVAGQRYLDRLAQDPHAPAEVRMEVAEGLRRLATLQAAPGAPNLSQVAQARSNLTRAESVARALPDDPASWKGRSLLLARIALARSVLASERDLDFAAARAALTEARSVIDDVLRKHPGDPEGEGLWLDSAMQDASTLQWKGQYADSIAAARAALERVAPAASTQDAKRIIGVRRAKLLDILAEGLYYSGDPPAAEVPYREEYNLLRELSAAEPQNVGLSRRVARAGWTLGSTLVEIKRAAEAEPILADAQAIGERLQLLEPDDADLGRLVDIVSSAHAQSLVAIRRFDEARPVLERSVNTRRVLWEKSPQDWSRARDYAVAQGGLGDMWADAGNARNACTTYRASLATFQHIRAAGKITQLDEDYTLRNIRDRMGRHCE